jgi:thiamine biosynthesis lipoprotein
MNPFPRNPKPETRNSSFLFRNPQAAIRIFSLAAALLLLCLFAPSNLQAQPDKGGVFRQSRILMGTSAEISVSRATPKKAEDALEAAFQEVERINVLMSHYRPDSEVSRITRFAGKREIRVSPETLEVIERALYFSRLSEGAFDITIGSIFRLWNFREGKIPDDQSLRENLKRVDYRKVKVDGAASSVFLEDSGMELDLGAIAKGYAVDLACAVLLKKGMEGFLVKLGGESKAHGEKEPGVPWIIGIQHPRLPSELLAKLKVRNAAISTSGDYEKFFLRGGERYHHILNPSTGMPAPECQSATILAPASMDADALATTVFVLGPRKGFSLIEKLPGVHAVIVDRRGSVLLSPQWPDGVLLPP